VAGYEVDQMAKGDDSKTQTSDARLTWDFIRLRRRVLWIGGAPFLLGIVLFFMGVYGVGLPSFGLPWSSTLTLPGVLVGWGLTYTYAKYRCPRCGAILIGAGVFKGAAFDLSVEECPECELPLKVAKA